MKRLLPALLAALIISPLMAEDSGSTGNVNGYLGAKHLDEDDWEPVENQGAFGVLFDIRGRDWPISLAANLIGSGEVDEDGPVDTTGSTSELQLGVKKIWDFPGKFHLGLGGGLAIVSAAIEVDGPGPSTDDDDSGLGAWLSLDPYWTFGHFNLGPHIAISAAEVTLFGDDKKAGGLHVGLALGYHW